MHRLLAWLRILLKFALLVSGAAVVSRAAFGPFHLGIAVRNPIGAESVFGVSAVLLLALSSEARGATGITGAPIYGWEPHRWHVLAIAFCLGLVAWARTFDFPFIADDYIHTWNGLHATAAYLGNLFTVPASDHFFRPFAYLAYAAEARLFGMNRPAWHAFSVSLHVLTALLVFAIARKMRIGAISALAAMAFFLLHGSRPEAVAWASAQFDLWAAFFVLAAILAFLRYRDTGRISWQAISLTALLCGLLSKESAYVYPFLVLLWVRLQASKWRESITQAAPALALAALVFLYRWILLGGIGGYREAGTGAAFFYNLNPVRMVNGLLARSAAVTMFPLNWSAPAEWWLVTTMWLAVASIAAVAIREPFRRRLSCNDLLFSFGFFLISALPAHMFLLIGADLEKSRVLYLPVVGAALAIGMVLDTLASRWAIPFAAALLAFQAAALEHNLGIWKNVAQLAEDTCAGAAREASVPGPLRMTGVPNVIDGIYFLHTGFRSCVEQAAGRESLPQLITDTDTLTPTEIPKIAPGETVRSFRWDTQSRKLVADVAAAP